MLWNCGKKKSIPLHGVEHVLPPLCSSASCSSSPRENMWCLAKSAVFHCCWWNDNSPQKVKFCPSEDWAQSTGTSSGAPWVQTHILSDLSPILRKKNNTQPRAWGRTTSSPNCADINPRGACSASVSRATFSIFRKINEQAHLQRLPRLLSPLIILWGRGSCHHWNAKCWTSELAAAESRKYATVGTFVPRKQLFFFNKWDYLGLLLNIKESFIHCLQFYYQNTMNAIKLDYAPTRTIFH